MLSPTVTRQLIGHLTDTEGGERRRHAREQLVVVLGFEREPCQAPAARQQEQLAHGRVHRGVGGSESGHAPATARRPRT
jgi:hypothetical protein